MTDREKMMAEIYEWSYGERSFLPLNVLETVRLILSELEQAQGENRKLREERDKLIEGLQKLVSELDRRYKISIGLWEEDGNMYEQGCANGFDIAETHIRALLKQIGVNIE